MSTPPSRCRLLSFHGYIWVRQTSNPILLKLKEICSISFECATGGGRGGCKGGSMGTECCRNLKLPSLLSPHPSLYYFLGTLVPTQPRQLLSFDVLRSRRFQLRERLGTFPATAQPAFPPPSSLRILSRPPPHLDPHPDPRHAATLAAIKFSRCNKKFFSFSPFIGVRTFVFVLPCMCVCVYVCRY